MQIYIHVKKTVTMLTKLFLALEILASYAKYIRHFQPFQQSSDKMAELEPISLLVSLFTLSQ